MPMKGPRRGASHEQHCFADREGCVVVRVSVVELPLTWPVWVPQAWGSNKISHPGHSISTSSPPALAAGPLQGLLEG